MKINKLTLFLIVTLIISLVVNFYEIIENRRLKSTVAKEQCNVCPDGIHYYKNDVAECPGFKVLYKCPDGQVQIGNDCYEVYENKVTYKCPDGQYEYKGYCYTFTTNDTVYVDAKHDTLFLILPNGDTAYNKKFQLKKSEK